MEFFGNQSIDVETKKKWRSRYADHSLLKIRALMMKQKIKKMEIPVFKDWISLMDGVK